MINTDNVHHNGDRLGALVRAAAALPALAADADATCERSEAARRLNASSFAVASEARLADASAAAA